MNNDNDDIDSNSEDKSSAAQKISFKRLQFAVKGVIEIAIPLHLELLKEQSENLNKYQSECQYIQLRSEQTKAAKTVQLLKADLRQLEDLNSQVQNEDVEWFQSTIADSTKDIIDNLTNFMEIHSDSLEPYPEIDDNLNTSNDFSALICDPNQTNAKENDEPLKHIDEIQIIKAPSSIDFQKQWLYLRKELLEIHDLIKRFRNLIFSHKESVDQIEDNIIRTHENVQFGTKHLKRATILRAASFPIAGAIVGGLLLGPIGALAGFKVIGSAACVASGSILGYTAGKKLKKNQEKYCNFEMKALTFPSKSHSHSDPGILFTSQTLSSSDKKND